MLCSMDDPVRMAHMIRIRTIPHEGQADEYFLART